MGRRDVTSDAIDRLVASGLIDPEEADVLRRRRTADGSAAAAVPATGPSGWSARRGPAPPPADRLTVADAASSPDVRPRTAAGARTAVVASSPGWGPVERESYESFAAAASRLWASMHAARRLIGRPRVLLRIGLILLTVLVVVFWVLLVFALMAPLPDPVRPALLMAIALGLVVFVRQGAAGRREAWSVGALLAAAGLGLAAVHATPWSFPYPLLSVPLSAALLAFVGAQRAAGPGIVLSAVPVVGVPWLTVLVAERSGLPMVPVFVALALLLLVAGTVAALPGLHDPERRRFAWRPIGWEPVVVAAAGVLLWVLPATLDRLEMEGLFPTFSVLFVLLTLFLYGSRVRSLIAIAFVLVAPVVLVGVALVSWLGAFGWLVIGAILGALGVRFALRRRLVMTAPSGETDTDVPIEVGPPSRAREASEAAAPDPRARRTP